MKTPQETFLIVAVAVSVFFGSLAGGITSYLLVTTTLSSSSLQLQSNNSRTVMADEQTTIDVVEAVLPSVVSIRIEEQNREGNYYESGGGTGFFVTSDGLVLTNRHVVDDDTAHYVVVTNDQTEYAATVLAKDVFLDLAVLQVDGVGFTALAFGDSDAVAVGQTVMAIGNSLSEFPNSVTKGIISGLDRTIAAGDYDGHEEVIEEALQTDAAISEGNSGGPLVDKMGRVIGINTAVSYEGQSLGFAIPINPAKAIIDDIVQYGRIIRPWLGVRYSMIDPWLKEQEGITEDFGAWIIIPRVGDPESIIAGSPAARIGLRPGDIIQSVNDVVLDADQHQLGKVMNRFEPGDTVTLHLMRDGQALAFSVTLDELDPSKF